MYVDNSIISIIDENELDCILELSNIFSTIFFKKKVL